MYGKVPLTLDASCTVAKDRVAPSNTAASDLLGQTEIEDFDQAVGGDDDIRRLQIAMNDASVMSAGECAGNLHAIAQDRLRRQSGIRAHGVQRLALDQLHHDVEFALGLANFVDGADVGMSESRRGARLVEQIAGLPRHPGQHPS